MSGHLCPLVSTRAGLPSGTMTRRVRPSAGRRLVLLNAVLCPKDEHGYVAECPEITGMTQGRTAEASSWHRCLSRCGFSCYTGHADRSSCAPRSILAGATATGDTSACLSCCFRCLKLYKRTAPLGRIVRIRPAMTGRPVPTAHPAILNSHAGFSPVHETIVAATLTIDYMDSTKRGLPSHRHVNRISPPPACFLCARSGCSGMRSSSRASRNRC